MSLLKERKSMFFNVMDVIFPIMFIVVAGFIVVTIIKGISQWNDNNHAPRLTVEAKVVAKRTNITHFNDGTDTTMVHTNTTYYVTFEVESGDRMEMNVRGSEYGMLAEGDVGKLTFQGTRYLNFERC
jgi:hypothetical protein